MNSLHARTVFFVTNAGAALEFYTSALCFSRDWVHEEAERPFVGQVSLHGFELIINQIDDTTTHRVGTGRVFIGLDEEQVQAFHDHLASNNIETATVQWGRPTVVIADMDGNELYFWKP